MVRFIERWVSRKAAELRDQLEACERDNLKLMRENDRLKVELSGVPELANRNRKLAKEIGVEAAKRHELKDECDRLIKTRIDLRMSRIDTEVAHISESLDTHDERITELEKNASELRTDQDETDKAFVLINQEHDTLRKDIGDLAGVMKSFCDRLHHLEVTKPATRKKPTRGPTRPRKGKK